MTRQLDFCWAYLKMTHQGSGVYAYELSGIDPCVSDPDATLHVDKQPLTSYPVLYTLDTSKTVQVMLDEILAAAKAAGGVA